MPVRAGASAASTSLLPDSMAVDRRPSNDSLLQQLRDGSAKFELASLSISPSLSGLRFFARIGSSLNAISPAMKKEEHYSVHKVTGDGRCMFRALVKGMARNKGLKLDMNQETKDADELRMAVKEVMCDNGEERLQYEEALVAITVEESLKRYCQRIGHSDFWGGESELLVLSKLCRQPIEVYIPVNEHPTASGRNGFIPIAEYGSEFKKPEKGKRRMVVKLLYSSNNHYDLLV
ncbi:OTU domain-containing protein At3g57810 isoform X1 [Phalaenopsis equestris]|uniref:OTU domain-containing protein At3g57810 isoform X1 n=1 Tax=Phalaenopsis equestris TaxID=78828 RepID=UPI0009E56C6F|nr:OTU domain-containing protein At3g57810 isoform X1 [Phalaenopsis equestris]